MSYSRLRSLQVQREALIRRIADAKEGPSASLLVPQMTLALEELDKIIAREQAAGTDAANG